MNVTMTVSNVEMSPEAKLPTGSIACLERLQREALNCLNSFPSKVIELNGMMEANMPDSIKTSSGSAHDCTARRLTVSSGSTITTIREYELSSITADADDGRCLVDLGSMAHYREFGTRDQSRSCRGIRKRRSCRSRLHGGASSVRRRPGSLGQILLFIASKLAICTRAMVIAPSWYIIDRIISMLFQRRQLKNAQCGPSVDWRSTAISSRVTSLDEDTTRVGSFIGVLRPIAVQLIADTTALKRWLQAIALNAKPPSQELLNATRTTETIDCWAYELFFHLKYMQVNRARIREKVPKENGETSTDEDSDHVNLWHRLVQLRDNYMILYETLYDEPKIHETIPPK